MGEATRAPHSALEAFQPQIFGRYVLYAPIARGGMATVHLARLFGAEGFSRIVAAKRLFRRFAEDPDFVKMFRDEAEIASRIRHPNVVPVLDMVLAGDEVLLVQEYVHGVPLDRLFRAACASPRPIPVRVVVSIVAGVLAGLHAAHEVRGDDGTPLDIVHRDVSPQNVIVGVDGAPRLLDFGVAQAATSAQGPNASIVAGKMAYMAPEQLRGDRVSRQSDVYSCGVLLWELLTSRRLHPGRTDRDVLSAVGGGGMPAITDALADRRSLVSIDDWRYVTRLDAIVGRALAPQPKDRFATAAAFLQTMLRACPDADPMETASWVKATGAEYLEQRRHVLATNEASWRSLTELAVSMASASVPTSGVRPVRPDVTAVSTLSGTLVSSPDNGVSLGDNASPRDRARRFAAWAIAGCALFATSAFGTLLVSRQTGSRHEAAAPGVQPAMTATAATAPLTPPPPVVTVEPADSIVEKTVESLPIYVPPPARRPAPASPLRETAGEAHPAATTTSPATSAERNDCDPPFFFQGTKKIFKPSCL